MRSSENADGGRSALNSNCGICGIVRPSGQLPCAANYGGAQRNEIQPTHHTSPMNVFLLIETASYKTRCQPNPQNIGVEELEPRSDAELHSVLIGTGEWKLPIRIPGKIDRYGLIDGGGVQN